MNNVSKICENFNIQSSPNTIREILQKQSGVQIQVDVPLAPRTTFKIGGNAAFFAEPSTEDEFCALLKCANENGLKTFILGGGSNLVISDDGLNALVVSTSKFDKIRIAREKFAREEFVCGECASGENSTGGENACGAKNSLGGECASGKNSLGGENAVFLHCFSGTTIESLTKFCIENAISGLETFAGLPGTCGGACYMNARCYEVSFSERIYRVQYVARDFSVKNYEFNENDWSYKKSPFQKMMADGSCRVILSVDFALKNGEKEKIATESAKYIEDRKNKGHFKFPSAGSVFKNNHDFGKPSGKIIDETGLRGFAVGGAQVASWHGNFIINTGSATSSDIKNLVEIIKKTVLEKTGFNLECEILFVNLSGEIGDSCGEIADSCTRVDD